RGLPRGRARTGEDSLAHRRARGQEGDADPAWLVRRLGRRDLRHRPGRGQDEPPVIRAPNGVQQDGDEFFAAGRPYYGPAKITTPTLLVHAEWDRDPPAYMAQTLFPLLVNAPGKRYVQLPEGTHTIMMEKNRLMLFEAVQAFLDEAGRS